MIGCAEAGADGPLPVYRGRTETRGPAHPIPTTASDHLPATPPPPTKAVWGGVTPQDPAEVPSLAPRFRDYAAYSFTDRTGRQWLSQTLLDLGGGTLHERFCPTDDVEGTLWDQCEAWNTGIQPVDLGIDQRFLSGLGAFVFRDASDMQILAQTAFTAAGDVRLGRLCPIFDKRPVLERCSTWKKLEAASAALGVAGVAVFRGDDTYAFAGPNRETLFAERVLSLDGTQSWHRTCASADTLFDGAPSWDWSGATAVTELDLSGATHLSGWGAHVYTNRGHQVFSETAISEDGAQSARRECLFGYREVDPRTCGPWTYRSLGTVLTEYKTSL